MTRKIAVIVIHGIGKQTPEFADKLTVALCDRCREVAGDDIIVRAANWAQATQDAEDELWQRVVADHHLHYHGIRSFLVDFVSDALAYQPSPSDRHTYDAIHISIAQTLRRLAQDAGEDAPLFVIAHSLGTIIASNYLYDLQNDDRKGIISDVVRAEMHDNPLERGETFASLYTLGSPIALWSLRYRDFGQPIAVPSRKLGEHHPTLSGKWINFYDRDDVVGYPLQTLNDRYGQVVTEDRQVNIGGLFDSWNPLSHLSYWTDKDIVQPIAADLMAAWQAVNPSQPTLE